VREQSAEKANGQEDKVRGERREFKDDECYHMWLRVVKLVRHAVRTVNIIKQLKFESEFLKEDNPVNLPSPVSIKDGELSISWAALILQWWLCSLESVSGRV